MSYRAGVAVLVSCCRLGAGRIAGLAQGMRGQLILSGPGSSAPYLLPGVPDEIGRQGLGDHRDHPEQGMLS